VNLGACDREDGARAVGVEAEAVAGLWGLSGRNPERKAIREGTGDEVR